MFVLLLFLLDVIILVLLVLVFNAMEQIRQMVKFFVLDKILLKGGRK